MWNRKELKEKGKMALNRNYWKAVLVSFITLIFFGTIRMVTYNTPSIESTNNINDTFNYNFSSVSPVVAVGVIAIALIIILVIAAIIFLLKAIIINPLEVGISKFHINAVENTGNISDLGTGFDVCYKRNAKTLFFRDLYVFLWSLLFVIPGIIKAYEYRMISYILSENPDINKKEAFALSKKMMKGNKFKAFVLDLSFILWYFLGIITFGIVFYFYVIPYQQLTNAALYEKLKENNQ